MGADFDVANIELAEEIVAWHEAEEAAETRRILEEQSAARAAAEEAEAARAAAEEAARAEAEAKARADAVAAFLVRRQAPGGSERPRPTPLFQNPSRKAGREGGEGVSSILVVPKPAARSVQRMDAVVLPLRKRVGTTGTATSSAVPWREDQPSWLASNPSLPLNTPTASSLGTESAGQPISSPHRRGRGKGSVAHLLVSVLPSTGGCTHGFKAGRRSV
jgi:hypothetical protein